MAVIPSLVPFILVVNFQKWAAESHPKLTSGFWMVTLVPIAVITLGALVAGAIKLFMRHEKTRHWWTRPMMRVFVVSWTLIFIYGALFSTAMGLSPYPPIETSAKLLYRIQVITVSLVQFAIISAVVSAAFMAVIVGLAKPFRVGKT